MRRLGVLAAALVTALGVVLAGAPSYAVTSAERTGASATREAGMRLLIPAIGVDAGILRVGVTSSGQLAIGRSVRDVYRWRHGVVPGRRGSAVLAGHTWSKGPGVFDRLGQLRPGNRIRVGRARFRVTRVRKVRRMSHEEVSSLFSDMGRPRLVLITCGDRNNLTGVYRTRIIVNARKIRRR